MGSLWFENMANQTIFFSSILEAESLKIKIIIPNEWGLVQGLSLLFEKLTRAARIIGDDELSRRLQWVPNSICLGPIPTI
jgi:hypothetical protein